MQDEGSKVSPETATERTESREQHNLALLGKGIIVYFNALVKNGNSTTNDELPYADWLHEYERFSLWADNLGLHHWGHSSLDYRLREAEALQYYIQSLLDDLKQELRNGEALKICLASSID